MTLTVGRMSAVLLALALLGPPGGAGLAAQDSTAAPPPVDSSAVSPPTRPRPRRVRRRLLRRPRPRPPPRPCPTRLWWWTGWSPSWATGRCWRRRWTRRSSPASPRASTCPTRRTRSTSSASRSSSSIVDEELLVQQAQRDTSIKVTDQEIADGVEQQVRKVRGNFNSEVDYRNELRKAGFGTPEEYRRWLTDQQRRAAFQNRLIDKLRQDGKLKPVPPTEPEMRAYFDEQKGQLGTRPATISFRQIVITPQPSAESKARTRAQADSIVLELRRGADFATAAKRFSQDPGLQGSGRVAQLVPPGRDGAGVRAGSVLAQAGRRVRSGRVAVRLPHHPGRAGAARRGAGPAHPARARRSTRRTSTARGRWPTRCERWSCAGRRSIRCSASSTTRRPSGRPTTCRPTSCRRRTPRSSARPTRGRCVPVFTLAGTGARTQFVVLQVIGRRPQGDIRYEDVHDRIREQLGQQLAIRRYLDRLRKSTYVDVRS